MTPEKLAAKVRPKIEGMIPDLCDGLNSDDDRRDALQDYAGDFIYDRYGVGVPVIIIRKAAVLIAEYYFGKEEETC